jgi:bacteriophage protein of unknown function (DUF646)|nr:MAG TPA: putative tail component [Caudoviricetes sp.]
MSGFGSQISAWADAVRQKLDAAADEIVQETHRRLLDQTPVDSGDLKASWTQSVSVLPTAFNGSTVTAKAGQVVYIATDKVYAPIIEYGLYPNPPKRPTGRTANGYSTQAPQGMVRITVTNMQNWLEGKQWT